MANIRYEVDIQGHRAPFKWFVFRAGGSSKNRTQLKSGESRSITQCVEDARSAAWDLEDERLFLAAKLAPVLLFEVTPKGDYITPEVRELNELYAAPEVEPQRPHPDEVEPLHRQVLRFRRYPNPPGSWPERDPVDEPGFVD